MPRLVHMVSTLLIMLVLMVLCGKKQADGEDTND